MDVRPLVLEGTYARLEPIDLRHAEDLYGVGSDDRIWLYMPRPALRSVADARQMIEAATVAAWDGLQLPFAIIERATGRAVGSTRYLDVRRNDRGLEIGWTWLGVAYQRTPINTECKYLLLRHAFDELGAVRVQLKTDLRNVRSQTAIERLGATREGVLRKHVILWNGFIRDTVYYSILDDEWPGVRRRLEAILRSR
jgi:RimJ/RimL family protein N-acetyltransferase